MATFNWLSLSSFTKATDEQRLGPTWIWCEYFFVLLPQLDDTVVGLRITIIEFERMFEDDVTWQQYSLGLWLCDRRGHRMGA